MAGRIVERFGEKTLEVISADPHKLAVIDGIGPSRVEMISQAWREQHGMRDLMVFLQSHDVSAGQAAKIYKHYGANALQVIRDNPYRMAADIFGIGFVTADRIAQKLGLPHDSPQRIEAGILYALQQFADDGHLCYPAEELEKHCAGMLQVPQDLMPPALTRLAAARRIFTDRGCTYAAGLYTCEAGIAAKLAALLKAQAAKKISATEGQLEALQKGLRLNLAPRQLEALRLAGAKKALVITGGPGTGKTTIIRAVLGLFLQSGAAALLAAPTGRAAKRMTEATGVEAKTIHRLLKYNPQSGFFDKSEDDQLECDCLIVDEASMIDGPLMYYLLKALPESASLILVGDVNQLPSVGPGSVLADIITSGAVPVVELTEIFRQARQSRIIVGAHAVNSGCLPDFTADSERLEDFYFIEKESPEELLQIILDLAARRIPARFGLDPVQDIQVLCPMYRGPIGVERLNAELQQALNPGAPVLTRKGFQFRLRDKVMQLRNNYDKDVFNGDMGRILSADAKQQKFVISFDGRLVTYEAAELDELDPAYAISVHKAQGSEFPAIILPVHTQHYMMLQRNLLYTGITRGRRLVVLVGTKKALGMAVRNNKTRLRHTQLAQRLQEARP
jgi:exodeoxyribonuclease V alpha subunit